MSELSTNIAGSIGKLLRHRWLRSALVVLATAALSGWLGCVCPLDERVQREARSSEPNDTFDAAMVVRYDEQDTAVLAGSIALGDIDVYDLGPLAAGDRVRVSVRVTFGGLVPTTAIFDADSRLFVTNPIATVGSRSFAFAETIRHDSGHYYLGIAEEYGTNTAGAYELTVELTRGGSVPKTRQQAIVLDFDGGHVDMENIGTFDFDPFSAQAVGFEADQTGHMKDLIQQTVEQNFLQYDVVIYSTDDELPDEDLSVVHFGGYDRDLFGISEDIDFYNRDRNDQSVIFTESFVDMFEADPTLEQMAVALGNIASHESGHLLGLNHVVDPNALMDSASPPDSFLDDQEFIWTRLARQIFPIGTHDSPLLLSETVGLRE